MSAEPSTSSVRPLRLVVSSATAASSTHGWSLLAAGCAEGGPAVQPVVEISFPLRATTQRPPRFVGRPGKETIPNLGSRTLIFTARFGNNLCQHAAVNAKTTPRNPPHTAKIRYLKIDRSFENMFLKRVGKYTVLRKIIIWNFP